MQKYAEKHRQAGKGFGFGLVGKNDTARALSAQYHKDGSEILISQCARILVSDTQAYCQFENSVVVPMAVAIGYK